MKRPDSITIGEDSAKTLLFLRRVLLMALLLALAFIIVTVRLTRIQIFESSSLRQMAAQQQKRQMELNGARGRIYDRNNTLLAISTQVDSVYADPSSIGKPREAAKQLANVLDMDNRYIFNKLAKDLGFVWIKRHVDEDTARRVQNLKIRGIGTIKEGKRFYPKKKMASHILGFVDIDNNGLEGVEKRFNSKLTAKKKTLEVMRDGKGRLVRSAQDDIDSKLDGEPLTLTIDATIQHAAEEALNKAVDSSGALGGSVVVVDVKSGEILAMANAPSYDPNNPGDVPTAARRNKAITDVFEPGSVFKTFSAAAFLEKDPHLDPDRVMLSDPTPMRVNHYWVKDLHPHKNMTATDVLVYSSNVGAATMAMTVGRDEFYKILKKLGFGAKTGINLQGEIGGILSRPDKWADIQFANISFGQGVAVTTLQLAMAYAAIANDGYYNPPKIIKGEKVAEGRQVISKANAKKLQKMLGEVVQRGTGRRAALAEYSSAGKTGTAQKSDPAGGYSQELYMALFAGFAPIENPQVAIIVNIDEPQGEHQGGTVSAPVFKEVAEASLKALLVPATRNMSMKRAIAKLSRSLSERDAPIQLEIEEEPEVPVQKGQLPSLNKQSAHTALVSLSKILPPKTTVQINGSGLVVKQEPAAGTPLAGIKNVVLYCEPAPDNNRN